MPIKVQCACGKAFQVKDEHAGKRAKCPACGQPLLIPGPPLDGQDRADPDEQGQPAVKHPPATAAAPQPAARPKPPAGKQFECADCGGTFPESRAVRVGGEVICKSCYIQRPAEPTNQRARQWVLLGGAAVAVAVAAAGAFFLVGGSPTPAPYSGPALAQGNPPRPVPPQPPKPPTGTTANPAETPKPLGPAADPLDAQPVPDAPALVRELDHPGARALAFAPDGNLLVSAGTPDKILPVVLKLWDPRTGEMKRALTTQDGEVRAIAFAPDGKTLAVTAGNGPTAKLWDVDKGAEKATVTGSVPIISCAFVADGTLLAAACGDAILLCDTQTGEVRQKLAEPPAAYSCIAAAPDGRTLASGSPGEVRLWDVATGKVRQTFPLGDKVSALSLAFAPGGRRLAAACGDGTVRAWDLETGKEMWASKVEMAAAVCCVAYSPDGLAIASRSLRQPEGGADGIELWDAETGTQRPRLASAAPMSPGPCALAFAPDGKRLAAGQDGGLQLWDARPLKKK